MNNDSTILKQSLLDMDLGKINRWLIRHYFKFREGALHIHNGNENWAATVKFIVKNIRKCCDYLLLGYLIGPMAKEDGQKAAKIFQVKYKTIIYINSLIITPLFGTMGHISLNKIGWLFGIPQSNSNAFSLLSNGFSDILQFISYAKPLAGFFWNGITRSSICYISNGKKILVPFSIQALVQNYDVYVRYWKRIFKKLTQLLKKT